MSLLLLSIIDQLVSLFVYEINKVQLGIMQTKIQAQARL